MKKILIFLSDTFQIEFGDEITEETDLLNSKLVDSLGYMKILAFMDDEFGVVMDEEELFSNVLVSAKAIHEFVQSKLNIAENT